MLSDFRFAFRQLRKSPGFALTAILTLALGIGVNTAIFSLVDSILLKPLPFPHQSQLVRIGYDNGQTDSAFFPKGWIRALGDRSNTFSSISGFGADAESNIGDQNSADRVFGAQVMVNALATLGVNPAIGRFFSPDDSMAGHAPDVILSYGYWKQRYAADPGVIGQSIRIDGISRQIIGILPAGVRFPYADTQFLTPVTFKGGDPIDPWKTFDLRAFGRLKPGVEPAQAQAELRRLQSLLLPMFPWQMPDSWASNMTVVPLLESEVGAMRSRLMLLFAAVGLVLLIACANVANLMLARAAGREREIAIRGALGASSGRLIRQLLSESILVGLLAGAAGLMAASMGLRFFVRLLPANTPRLASLGIHWHTFLFVAAISVFTGLLFGLVPALRMASPHLQDALRAGSRGVSGKAAHFRAAMLLVVGQIGLTVVVITAAGLLLHSLYRLSEVNPGFRTDRIITAEVSLNSGACQQAGQCQAFFQTLLDRVQGIAGVERAALTNTLPLRGQGGSYVYDAQGHPRTARQASQLATGRSVSPGYFATLGIGLVRGRLLDDQDASGASRAVVISQSMAARLWPHQDPLGQHILNVADELTPAAWNATLARTVVGVVSNTHEGSLAAGYGDEVYLPMTPNYTQPVMFVLLRTRVSTQQAADALRQAVAAIDPQVPVTHVQTLNELVASSDSASCSLAILLLGFGALAVIIGSMGVYSLIAYIVSWRTKEIGIRLALGAQRWIIVRQVVARSVALAAAGCAVGMAAAGIAAHLLHSFLFGISPLDPLTFACVPVLMLLLAVAAAWIPARRAAGIQPIEALRVE